MRMHMFELRAWIIIAGRLARYFAYRLGMAECPTFLDVYPECVAVFDRIMGWPKRLRVEGAEHCPKTGPAVFVGNHQKKDDPFIMYRAVHRVCNWSYEVRYMMRDDFFKSLPKWKLFDIDEILRTLGALPISRENVLHSQLKPFVKLLREGNAFIMYPGRSRTRSGLFMEYREGIDEPGGATFFLAQAQRGHPELKVPAVPMTRTYNPVTKKSTITFGEPQYLPEGADRAAQRELDFRLLDMMGDMVEISVPLVTAGILYLHCLHSRPAPIEREALADAVREALLACRERRHVDRTALEDLSRELRQTLKHFQRGGMLTLRGALIEPNRAAVLSVPEPDTAYVKKNPVKHLVNQIIHLADVVAAIEAAAARL